MTYPIYKLKIQLKGITNPPVWRKVLIPSYASFQDLHYVIQAAFGWEDEHLYEFSKKPYDKGWKVKGDEHDTGFGGMGDDVAAKNVALEVFLNEANPKITYLYDFGDDWVHEITLESVEKSDKEVREARCIGAKGCCPPEDCGGPHGYMMLKQIIEQHPEDSIIAIRQEYISDDWDAELGEQDENAEPEDFDGIDFVMGAGPFFPLKDGKPDFVNVDLKEKDLDVSCIPIKGVVIPQHSKLNVKGSKGRNSRKSPELDMAELEKMLELPDFKGVDREFLLTKAKQFWDLLNTIDDLEDDSEDDESWREDYHQGEDWYDDDYDEEEDWDEEEEEDWDEEEEEDWDEKEDEESEDETEGKK